MEQRAAKTIDTTQRCPQIVRDGVTKGFKIMTGLLQFVGGGMVGPFGFELNVAPWSGPSRAWSPANFPFRACHGSNDSGVGGTIASQSGEDFGMGLTMQIVPCNLTGHEPVQSAASCRWSSSIWRGC